MKFDKNNIWYQVELALAYMTDDDYKAATPMWEKICREIPYNIEFLTNLATCYMKTNALDKASDVQSRLNLLMEQQEGDDDTGRVEVAHGHPSGQHVLDSPGLTAKLGYEPAALRGDIG